MIPRPSQKKLSSNTKSRKREGTTTLAGRLRFALELRGVSESQLAKDLGVNSGQVTKWLDGQDPRATAVTKICRALGISAHWLLTNEPPIDPPDQGTVDVYRDTRAQVEAELRDKVFRALTTALAPNEPTSIPDRDAATIERAFHEVAEILAKAG